MYYWTYECKIGLMYLVSDGESLCGCYLEDQKYFPDNFDKYIFDEELEIFNLVKLWLNSYFNNEKPSLKNIPMKLIGTDFRKKIWSLLKEISYGEVVTYKDLAKKIAELQGKEQMSAQAVGSAVGHNPLSIFIPCHRVIGTDGSLTGYAAGLKNKKYLLNFESGNNNY